LLPGGARFGFVVVASAIDLIDPRGAAPAPVGERDPAPPAAGVWTRELVGGDAVRSFVANG